MQKPKLNEMLIPISIVIAGAIFSGTVMLSDQARADDSSNAAQAISPGGNTQRQSGASCGV